MSRIDTISRALDAHLFINLHNRPDDETLRDQFDSLSPEAKQQCADLATPKPSHPEALDPEILSDAALVARHYAFRMVGSEQLPPFLRRAILMADDSDSADVLLLSALTAASACMPNLRGSLLDEEVRPNLYTLITGSAASGKGKAALCRRLLDPIDALRRIVIPGNSSATAMNEALYEFGGHGIIFETETDTLSHAFRLGGSFSSDLRKAFHGESISYRRRTNHEEVVIPDPQLSLFLTGTPGQTHKLLHDTENGLFSRMLFYRLTARKESFVAPEGGSAISATAVRHYYEALGYELRDLYLALLQHGTTLRFALSDEQSSGFLNHFNNITNAYEQLAIKAYMSEDAADQMTGICRRMGNICYRLLMIMSALRQVEQGAGGIKVQGLNGIKDQSLSGIKVQGLSGIKAQGLSGIKVQGLNGSKVQGVSRIEVRGWSRIEVQGASRGCDLSWHRDDFDTMVLWAEMLMHHTLIHYDELLVDNGLVSDDEVEPDLDSPDLLNEAQRQLWEALPKNFINKEAILIALENGIQLRTTAKYLDLYLALGLLRRTSRGCYSKK